MAGNPCDSLPSLRPKHNYKTRCRKDLKEMIKKGLYRFSIDKNGEILPTIRDASGIVKQVRLEEFKLTPELSQSLGHLNTHAAMAQILDEIEYVGDAIKQIHIELQNER